MMGLLARERSLAPPGYNRWMLPPAALAMHLCIGMAYGFSVFWLPLSRALGVDHAVTCPDMTLLDALVTTTCDWRVSDLGWVYTLFFVFLGSAAALWGGWLERVGPRLAGVVAALCWSGGLAVAALGVAVHQLWVIGLGAGAIGGVGIGLGYISPVSMLIGWFPDRRGMATGLAIMGFGGGALVGAPLANLLIERFRTAADVGVWPTLLVLAAIYAVFMLAGAFGYRVPPRAAPAAADPAGAFGSTVPEAMRTRQFWLIWAVLCLNVSAGIGVIGVASPILQEIFAGRLIGQPGLAFADLAPPQLAAIATIAAAFTGLISLFNIAGRFFWASISDLLGRKVTFAVFFVLGIALYASAPTAAHAGSRALFVVVIGIAISMYGGGFATVPAYLADVFGTRAVGAIHGRLLTAWSTAGVIGPVIVNYLRQSQIEAGVPRAEAYDRTLYILAGLLAFGFIANAFIRPVRPWSAATAAAGPAPLTRGRLEPALALPWLAVALPIAWGVWVVLSRLPALFG